jgi:RNA polymerase sigma-70 factor (ECF subfamily)
MKSDLDQLWLLVRDGNEHVMETLYKQTFSHLLHYAQSITGDRQTAEEVVQDVMLRLWQNRATLIVHGSFQAYLFQSVHNHALNVLRSLKTRKQSVNKTGSEELWEFVAANYNLDFDILDQLFAENTATQIAQAIEELPEQGRKVFTMSRVDQMNNDEIASQLNLSESTVRTHIYRALLKIMEALKKNL